jgi:LacI family transcriptional regulator
LVGIRDVARKANVSPTTVSRVLNRDQTLNVTAATRERIFEVVDLLGYDITHWKTTKKRTPSIGVISTISRKIEAEDEYYHELRLGLEREANRLHIGMNRLYNVSENPQQWSDLEHLGALIVIGNIDKAALDSLLRQNPNIIVVDNPDIQAPVDMVYSDLERMTTTVLEQFLANGYQDIAYIGGQQVDLTEDGVKVISNNEKRLRSYLHFMSDHQLEAFCDYYLGEWTSSAGEALAKRLLKKRANHLPKALLVASDPLAIGVYKALQTSGLAIGRAIQVVSFDDSQKIATLSPGLSSVKINAQSLGKSAVRMAVERIDGLRDEPIILTYPTKLVVRDSFRPKEED